MDNMLGKVVRSLVTVREEYLATLVDLLEKLTGKDGVIWMKNLRLFLRKEQMDWSKEMVVRTLKKLAFKTTIVVKANKNVPTKDFFEGKCGVKVGTSDRFKEVVFQKLPTSLSCDEHQRDVFNLTLNMWDSEIQAELKTAGYRPVEEVIASMTSRIMMYYRGEAGHELLINGYANIEHGLADDGRVVAVCCSFHRDARGWFFHCYGLGEHGRWDGDDQFSTLTQA